MFARCKCHLKVNPKLEPVGLSNEVTLRASGTAESGLKKRTGPNCQKGFRNQNEVLVKVEKEVLEVLEVLEVQEENKDCNLTTKVRIRLQIRFAKFHVQ